MTTITPTTRHQGQHRQLDINDNAMTTTSTWQMQYACGTNQGIKPSTYRA